ncbi:MAG: anti-sigma factor family protein [Planctomycetota bacterium]
MSQIPANTDPPLDEQLVAYLDGELDAEAARQVDALLARDPEARRRLQGLDRAWDLLGSLDTAEADSRFAESTLEMVAQAAAAEVEQTVQTAPRRRLWRRLQWAGLLALVATLGFSAVWAALPNPNGDLLRHLKVVEQIEPLMSVDGIEHLRALHRAGVFSEEVEDLPYSESSWYRWYGDGRGLGRRGPGFGRDGFPPSRPEDFPAGIGGRPTGPSRELPAGEAQRGPAAEPAVEPAPDSHRSPETPDP